jgi:hypothetical protein
MKKLYYAEAFAFYRCHINREDFFRLLQQHNLKTSGSVPPIAWELFGSILTGRKGKSGYGADLDGVEIKSAIQGSSFEYQYHLNTGLEKLEEDKRVDHFFCSYSADYQSFTVYFAKGKALAEYFQKWIPEYIKNYKKAEGLSTTEASERRQRFRRSIPFGWISKKGTLVMQVESGKLVLPKMSANYEK